MYGTSAARMAHDEGMVAVAQLVLAAFAFRLDRESPRVLWSMPLQQFVYRQLMYLVVIQSVWSALYGLRLRWQVMRRSGEMDAVPVGART